MLPKYRGKKKVAIPLGAVKAVGKGFPLEQKGGLMAMPLKRTWNKAALCYFMLAFPIHGKLKMFKDLRSLAQP